MHHKKQLSTRHAEMNFKIPPLAHILVGWPVSACGLGIYGLGEIDDRGIKARSFSWSPDYSFYRIDPLSLSVSFTHSRIY